ncbi:YedE-related selenium metabolism membrane protein [Budviciaceae bacterium CWB-B4]|uniref:YedE-related selenium metabolism membrane protein n=1 Tax=Limnobaculum xujianqingii TaxID=2738837 RepID=A0A9D7AHL2_9GAMM|nr:YedE family putative selenium transporter [Limnobaculum xujianqingii]MBK5072785.1 YedE-related selenium metabolism membrane protein [Limnobaculum xujianqingii]MBK5176094.1 YedE-related selenium metabolism membrane protein [Limnobaculum xujianqingii]
MSRTWILIISGIVIGAIALTLAIAGNPPNMGVCVACFIRDSAGSLNLHSTATVQYLRPEIFGFVIGAFATALIFKEFKAKAGSAPVIRFTLGFLMMIGCLVFLGCPLRMVLRIGAGDLNAVIGLVGLVAGIGIGSLFLKKGFSLPRNYSQSSIEGILFPVICIVLLMMFLWNSGIFSASEKGPGASHAPVWLSIIAGLVIGVVVQRTRFCFIGMAKNIFLSRNYNMALGVLALTLIVAAGNLYLDKFTLGFDNQPIAHTDGVWNFLSMMLVGLCGVFITGCPLRQLISAGQGSSDAAISVLGMLIGAAFAHNFAFASSPAGPTENGKIVVIVGIVLVLAIGVIYTVMTRKTLENATDEQ